MTIRGTRLHAIARRLFDRSTMERLIDPAIADLQHEHGDRIRRPQQGMEPGTIRLVSATANRFAFAFHFRLALPFASLVLGLFRAGGDRRLARLTRLWSACVDRCYRTGRRDIGTSSVDERSRRWDV